MSDNKETSSSSRLAQVLSNTWSTLDRETNDEKVSCPAMTMTDDQRRLQNQQQPRIKKFLRQNSSLDMIYDQKNESKVLVLYTGGTIGMVRNAEGVLAPAPNALEKKIRSTCTMHDEEYSCQRFGQKFFRTDGRQQKTEQEILLPLVLPHVPGHRRVIYKYVVQHFLSKSLIIFKGLLNTFQHL